MAAPLNVNRTAQPDHIYINHISNKFADGVVGLEAELEKSLNALAADPSNPVTLAQYQAQLAGYTLYRTAQSETVKKLEQIDMAIARNVGT